MTKVLETRARHDRRVVEAQLAKKINRHPYFYPVEEGQGALVQIDGCRRVNMASNNYLGFSTHPELKQAAKDGLDQWGTGATGSRLLNGTLSLHTDFESDIAETYGKESALIFSTGYQANLGLISGLISRSDVVLMDSESHASIFDAIALSRAKGVRFEHNCVADLQDKIQKYGDRVVACVVEGVYSMLGDQAPLQEIAALCRKHGIYLIVDEAHGIGVLGKRGLGASEHCSVLDDVDALVLTFAKALGSCGGAVVASNAVIEQLKVKCRPFIFTTRNTPSSLLAAQKGFQLLKSKPELLLRLESNAAYLRNGFKERGIPCNPSQTPIVTVPVGDDFRVLQTWKLLYQRGVFTNPVLTPAVAKGRGVIRLSVMATHSQEHLDTTLEAFDQTKYLFTQEVSAQGEEQGEINEQ